MVRPRDYLLLRFITYFSAFSFASSDGATCTVEENNSCFIKVWKVPDSSTSVPVLMAKYKCTPKYLSYCSYYSFMEYSYSDCLLHNTDSIKACTSVSHAPNDGRTHVAVVPQCVGHACSLDDQSENLGKAKYDVFVIWDSYNCSNANDGDVHLPPVPIPIPMSIPVGVTEDVGLELQSFASKPNYVVEININQNNVADLLFILFAVLFALISCTCCFLTSCRALSILCLSEHVERISPLFICVAVFAFFFVCGLWLASGYFHWFGLCPTENTSTAVVVISVVCGICWPFIVIVCCLDNTLCGRRENDARHSQVRQNAPSNPVEPIRPIVPNRPIVPVRSSYTLDIDRLAVKHTYKIGRGMNDMCAICLEEFNEGEEVRELPCLHVYHGGCAEKWLNEYKHTCPLCKTSITARRKKRVVAGKSERTPLLAAAVEETSVYYGSSNHDGEGEREGEGSAVLLPQ